MGIFIGLLTALTWGGADFTARFSTHRIGTLRTMFYMQFVGFLLLTLSMRWLGGWGHLADGSGWQPWAWGFLAGSLNACGTLSLYRSFEIGKMAVVAPLSASYPALTLILSWLGGDHLSSARVVGILFILLGVVVVAGGEHAPSENSAQQTKTNTRGIGWAIVAAVAFGLLFWLLGIRVVPRVGAVQAVWMIRLTSASLTALIIVSAAQPMHLPRGGVRWMALGMGAFDTLAFV
ncbi:MAG TPA: EamA family transporter, partial [Candidatus Acidoferrum sp.]